MNRFSAIVFLFLCMSFTANAQNCFDEIKDLPVKLPEADSFVPMELLELDENYYCFIGEELDTMDVKLLSKGPILAHMYVSELVNDDKDSKVITYGDIYALLIKTKNAIPEYEKVKNLFIESSRIEQLPALYSSWHEIESLLEENDISKEELEPFRAYLKENEDSNKTIREIRIEYQAFAVKEFEESQEGQDLLNKNEQFERLFANYGAIDIESLIIASLEFDQPILLYFTGYNCVNCRRMEENIFRNSFLLDEFENNFIFVSLYGDDKSKLEHPEKIVLNDQMHLAETVGDINISIEISQFGVATQPYFVALRPDGEILGSTDYEKARNQEDFEDYLNEVLLKWNSEN